MGYQVGLAKFMNESVRTNISLKGLFLAAFFHGAYDFVLFQNSSVLLTLLVFPIMIWTGSESKSDALAFEKLSLW